MKLIACAALILAATPVAAGDVRVEVTGAPSTAGVVRVALCDKAGYPKTCALNRTVPAGQKVSVMFENVAPGRYAPIAFHDANGDAKLNQGLMGIPKEGYGFIGGGGRFGAPGFEAAAVDVPASGATVNVRLLHWMK